MERIMKSFSMKALSRMMACCASNSWFGFGRGLELGLGLGSEFS